jgi:hypothetical protein
VLGEQTLGLVVNLGGNRGELVRVSASMMRAEQEFASLKDNAHVSLSAAAVAAVRGSQRNGRGGACGFFHAYIKPS